ncbi:MAG: putative porin [Acidobacteriota bacterium]|nr:putative porin [Acidobacteriota bacterium]
MLRVVGVGCGLILMSTQSLAQTAPWYERIQFGGDFRPRYEGFYQDGSETRHRSRFRLRLRIDSDVNDDTHLQIQIATGDPGTPVSTNQTFTSFLRPKPFNLDRANIRYNPKGASALTLTMGKFGPPMTRTQMVWDNDLNFEGGYERVAW